MSESFPVEESATPATPWFKKWWGVTLIVFGALVVLVGLFGPDPDDTPAASQEVDMAQPDTSETETAAPDTPEATPAPEDTEEEAAPEQPEEQLTIGQRNALRSAESYLRFSAFSRTGLIGQLEFEGYDTDDATFAVDLLDVDWNEQAALKAESYLEFSSFSRSGLIDQLLFEGFTRQEAEFGVTQVGY